ncbi:MAG TPA: hypothetical protein DEA08_34165 [Planctomycetes bacterium]|nr:hypothetical protein [Planctomycetota bacterium]
MSKPSSRLLRLGVLALALAFAQGCLFWIPTMIVEELIGDDPPRVNTSWANASRGVVSPDTPKESEDPDPIAEYDDGEERDTNELEDLDHDEDLGRVVIELGAGVYLLERAVTLWKPTSVVLRGKGPHKTRLLLDSDEKNSLRFYKPGSVRIEGLTVAAYGGDGIRVVGCDDVEVVQAHFAGSYHGLALEDSVAHVQSSVFAGCQRGIFAKGSKLEIEQSAFADCWDAIRSRNSGFTIQNSVFLDNRNVLRGTIDGRTKLTSNLIFGERQELGWEGRPALAAHNLVHFRHLGEALGTKTNRELADIEHFPDHVLWPTDFDVVAVHLALFTLQKRGESDPPSLVEELRRQRSEQLATAVQTALREEDLPAARRLAKLALQYLGPLPLSDAPTAVKEIADLGT